MPWHAQTIVSLRELRAFYNVYFWVQPVEATPLNQTERTKYSYAGSFRTSVQPVYQLCRKSGALVSAHGAQSENPTLT